MQVPELGVAVAGAVAKRTTQAFDEKFLTLVEDMAPERIRDIRLRENASQPAFGLYLNETKVPMDRQSRDQWRPRAVSAMLPTLLAKNCLAALARLTTRRRNVIVPQMLCGNPGARNQSSKCDKA